MLPINKKLKLLLFGEICSATIALLITAISQGLPPNWNVMKSMDVSVYKIFFKPRLRPHPDFVILDCHDPHENHKRSDYAKMIRRLQQAGAKLIAFDIRLVGEDQHDPAGDRELAQTVKGCPRVILPIDFAADWLPPPNETNPYVLRKLAHLDGSALPDSLWADILTWNFAERGVDLPYDSLFFAARHVGFINSLMSEYHRFPPVMVFQRNKKCYASLPVEIARNYLQKSDSLFEQIAFYLDGDGQLLVNFIPVEEFQPFYFHYSWEDTSSDLQSSANHYRDKIVFVVNPSAETLVQTCLGAYPRWALLASLTSQLLLNRYIESSVIFTPAFYSAFLVFLGLLWLLFVAPRLDNKWRKTRVIFIAGTGLFLLLIFLLLNLGRQWIGVVVPLFVFNASMVVARKVYYKWTKTPQYVRFGLAVSERQGNKYPVQVFESEVGVDTSDISFESFLEEEKFQDTINRIKEWEASREDIRWIGDKFFNALFQSQVYHLLQNSLDKAQRENKYVRLRLRLDAPELVCLPWELMHSSNLDSEYIALHRRLSLVRFLPLERLHINSPSRRSLKVLVFISRSRTNDLDVLQEMKNIKKALRPLMWSLDVRLKICEQATLENLSRELEGHPDILHYIGHADFDDQQNEAYLEFDAGHKVFARTLKGLLAESSIKLAVLNSCKTAAATETDAFTGVAQNLVKVGIPAVVAMQLKIPDDTATWFSEVFYAKLLQFHSIAVAVAETRRKIMERTELDQQHWATPVLFMREGEPILFDSS